MFHQADKVKVALWRIHRVSYRCGLVIEGCVKEVCLKAVLADLLLSPGMVGENNTVGSRQFP